MGAGWCPPGMLGIGIGGTAEKAMLLAKQSLMDDIDMAELKARGPKNKTEELRIELCDKVNALGIGAQGLGGLTTVLDVKIAMCADPRREQAGGDDPELRGDAPRPLRARRLGPGLPRPAAASTSGPTCTGRPTTSARSSVDLDTLTREEVASWKPGDTLLLSRQDAHRPRRRAQAHPGHAGQGREAAGRLHAAASSTTSARSIRCATRSSARPARPPRRAWTSSPR